MTVRLCFVSVIGLCAFYSILFRGAVFFPGHGVVDLGSWSQVISILFSSLRRFFADCSTNIL